MTDQSSNREYTLRINRTFDYIETHLHKQFTLEELADVANFSKFHFDRIFRALVGETPFQFIQRLRLEKAAAMLFSNPHDSVTEIAFKCGFTDLSVFSRNFKTRFKQSATQYRREHAQNSNISQINSKPDQSRNRPLMYFCSKTKTIKWKTNMELNKGVEIKDFPSMELAYYRYTGPYKGDEKLFERLWNKLFTWAGPRGLIGGPGFKSLIIYHDSIEVTDEDKLRTSVCITVPPETKAEGEIGRMQMEGGKYVVAHFELAADEFHEAWQWVYGKWFSNSGYQPDDRPCFELYEEEAKEGKYPVDICVPVKPL